MINGALRDHASWDDYYRLSSLASRRPGQSKRSKNIAQTDRPLSSVFFSRFAFLCVLVLFEFACVSSCYNARFCRPRSQKYMVLFCYHNRTGARNQLWHYPVKLAVNIALDCWKKKKKVSSLQHRDRRAVPKLRVYIYIYISIWSLSFPDLTPHGTVAIAALFLLFLYKEIS